MPAIVLSRANPRRAQGGAALAVSLVMLLLMTMIGLAGMQSTVLEERMTGNLRDRDLAFKAAESALQNAESLLDPSTALPTFSDAGTSGFYSRTSTAVPDWKASSTWTTANSLGSYTGGTLAKVKTLPSFFIEELAYTTTMSSSTGGGLEAGAQLASQSGTNTYYRITARGTGGTDNAEVIVQSVFRR